MNTGKIILNPGEEKRLLDGHPWVYNNEVNRLLGRIQSGDIVSVYSYQGDWIGQGFLNTQSKIFVRLLSRSEAPIDLDFFRRKLIIAKENRIQAGYQDTFRAFYAEADGIPGLIIDKYGEYIAVQFLSLGLDLRKQEIVSLIQEVYQPKGIYERSDSPIREKEGLPSVSGNLFGTTPKWVVTNEGECRFLVDIQEGQKTGTFLDQTQNHLAIRPYCSHKRVLDCFSHAGHFAIQAAHAGAQSVTAVDLSEDACQMIQKNQEENAVDLTIVKRDVFEFLQTEIQQKATYDLIILDPPAFTKTKNKLPQAKKGYKHINLQAMRLLTEGGILVSASCSQHLLLTDFLEVIREAAAEAKKQVQLLELKIQGSDHPALLNLESSFYLKFLIMRVSSL